MTLRCKGIAGLGIVQEHSSKDHVCPDCATIVGQELELANVHDLATLVKQMEEYAKTSPRIVLEGTPITRLDKYNAQNVLLQLGSDQYVSEWKHLFHRQRYDYRAHTPKHGSVLKSLRENYAITYGNPWLEQVLTKKQVEEKAQ